MRAEYDKVIDLEKHALEPAQVREALIGLHCILIDELDETGIETLKGPLATLGNLIIAMSPRLVEDTPQG